MDHYIFKGVGGGRGESWGIFLRNNCFERQVLQEVFQFSPYVSFPWLALHDFFVTFLGQESFW